jgi:hypothetical protein
MSAVAGQPETHHSARSIPAGRGSGPGRAGDVLRAGGRGLERGHDAGRPVLAGDRGGASPHSGPLLGVVILLFTARSLTFVDITGSLVYTLVVPSGAIALTLYYFDLQARLAARRK